MLLKKLFRDVKGNISQFITIFLMVFLGVFVFSGIHSYIDGMTSSAQKYYKNNNLQDIWLMGTNFTIDDLNTIKDLDNIKDAERLLTIETTVSDFKNVSLETNFITENNIAKMHIVEGEKFDKDKNGIWLDSYLAESHNLKVGDEITLTYNNYKITEEIKGLINTPDHVYTVKDSTEVFPNHKNYGYAYLSINEFFPDYIYDEIKNKIGINDINLIKNNFNLSDYYIFNKVIIDVEKTSLIDETKSDLENKTNAISITDRNSNVSYEAYNSEIEEGSTYSTVFTFLFLFIAILSVITTMNRFVKKQRTQIGTLKALGFKDKKITRHYICYGFYISLLASILGMIVGNLTIGRFFLNSEMSYFEVPNYSTTLELEVYLLALFVVLLVSFVTYLSCKNVLKEPPSESLRVQMPVVKKAKFTLTTKGIFKKFSLSTRWNLRDVSRNRGRSLMAVIGTTGAGMLLVCALGLFDSLNSYISWQFDKLYDFNYKLVLESDITEEEYNNITNTYGNSTSETLGIEIDNNNKKEVNTLTVNDAKEHLRYTNHNKNYIDLENNGVYITEKLSLSLGLEKGDYIKWHIIGNDKWYNTKIVGINRDPSAQQLNMTRTFYESLGLSYKADSLYTNKKLKDIKSIDGVSVIQSKSSLQTGMESLLNTMQTMIIIMIIVAAILEFVIIYNLGILSFSEKQYQFATLKVLGFKNKQIKNIFIKQNIWLTIIAIILALPLGYLFTDFIFKSALGDTYDFNAEIRVISYIISSMGTLLVAYIVNKIIGRKIDNIDMVSSLKGNE